jgi:uncharacterized protein YdiU (UPF0061 family)
MSHLQAPTIDGSSAQLHTLATLPKSNIFTSNLPPDPEYPTPEASHNAPRENLGPRLVKGALFTYVRPEITHSPELLAVSERALKDLGLDPKEAESEEFRQTVAGNHYFWDEQTKEGVYPWAQCYGGYQFGQWAGQLGDGRAISLFESINPNTGKRYEVQLKGAGRTPYSRFADGKAVLRSSIREFVVSEYLNAIGIPTTRALALTLCPKSKVMRERTEPGAIVTRFAESWVRFGTFDLQRMRGDRKTLRKLADYTAENIYGGWDKLPRKLPPGDPKETYKQAQPGGTKNEVEFANGEEDVHYTEHDADTGTIKEGPSKEVIEGEGVEQENRYTRLYRAICRANARTVAHWQAYGFMNGVLNTDNTSILGLSMDYGPFAFLDTFDPTYTPNHDDHMLRYSYRNQPTIIWWNLVRLGENLGELMGMGARVDEETFVEKGIEEKDADELVKRAEATIDRAGDEYKAVFMAEYSRLMAARLGLKTQQPSDFETLFSEFLDVLEKYELDFHHAFRRLGSIELAEVGSEEGRRDVAGRFFRSGEAPRQEDESRVRIGAWLEKWAARVKEDWGEAKDVERQTAMAKVNPKVRPCSPFAFFETKLSDKI